VWWKANPSDSMQHSSVDGFDHQIVGIIVSEQSDR